MLIVHRAERADALVDALVEELRVPVGDPFAAEVVAVPTRGVERWITHRLAAAIGTSPGRGDGVCANVDFPSPQRLVEDVVSSATGHDPRTDPWRADRLAWPLLSVLDEVAGQDWCRLLGRHLGVVGRDDGHDDLRRRRRLPAARHVARLFDRYNRHRPDLVRAWLDGDDGDLPDDAVWQPELLRRVAARLDVSPPASRAADALEALAAGAVDVDLPPRLSVFGVTALPATELAVLEAVSATRAVHLYVLHPSATLWEQTVGEAVSDRRADDPVLPLVHNPLLRTWGQDSRELQTILRGVHAEHRDHPLPPERPASLLALVQDDIRANRVPGATVAGTSRVVTEADRSVQIHACHGRARQVEVARDAIAHALADDHTLEPRDVIVLCPDIDELAPLLHATFGSRSVDDDEDDDAPMAEGPPVLPYRLADRSLRETNPMLAALDDLLGLIDSRFRASDLLRFASRGPVARAFGFDDDGLSMLRTWFDESGLRWGLDQTQRAAHGLGDVRAGTAVEAVDRILLGVAMSTDHARLVGDRLPVDQVDSRSVELAGRFAELVDRLRWLVEQARIARSLPAWADLLETATDLVLAAPHGQEWQRAQVTSMLRAVRAEDVASSTGGADGVSIGASELRDLLSDRLAGEPTRADFRTGAITICSLVPMRAVPHRVVVVLGLDDGVFPRNDHGDGDDLLRAAPRIGDPDRGAQDRQLLLDAVLSATETLIVTYSGRDERTNEERPPSVPLHELLAVLDDTAETTLDDVSVSRAVTVVHPLQRHDRRAFQVGELRAGRPWSFDAADLAGARAALRPSTAVAQLLDPPLDPFVLPATLPIDDLVRFFDDPFAALLSQRLGVSTWDGGDVVTDAIPIELDGLGKWGVGSRILDRLRAGIELDDAVEAERAAGLLPPGQLGEAVLDDVARAAANLDRKARNCHIEGRPGAEAIEVPVTVRGPDGPTTIRIVGTVGGLHGSVIGRVTYSSEKAKQRLAAWIELLALTAALPATEWRATTVAKHRSNGRSRTTRVPGFAGPERADVARQHLGDLVSLWVSGMQTPLPLPSETGHAWAATVHGSGDLGRAAAAAGREWNPGFRFRGEASGSSAVRCLGGVVTFDELLAIRATDAESGPGWASNPSRFARLAQRVWTPVLDAEAAS